MPNRYVQFDKTGGPEVLTLKTEDIPIPGHGEVVVKNKSIGFNFLDTCQRSGIYKVPLPYRPGGEGSGIVYSVGTDVSKVKKGDRVVYSSYGSYSEYTKVAASAVIILPDNISFDVAAGSLLKGLTVQYLLQETYVPRKDEIILFHAGAGGVGLIFLQWARSLGVKVITTVSTDDKAELVRAHGAWQVLKYTDDIPANVKEITKGKMVKAVYDAVGKDTFEASLNSLAKRGHLVSFGNASGAVPPFAITRLTEKGSLWLTRPGLYDYIEDIERQSLEFFKLVSTGVIKIEIKQAYKLEDVKRAHADAEARKTCGSTVIHP